MKLYYTAGVCSLSPHIILQEIGKPFEIEKVDLKNKTTETGQDYLKISNRGAVPLLQLDDGQTIREGVVILQYLCDTNPECDLLPKHGTMDRVRADEWLNFITTDLHKSFFVFFYDGGDKAKELYTAKLNRHFAMIEEELTKKTYITGDKFTAADAYLYTVLTWTYRVNLSLADYPTIRAYMNKIEQRPSVQRALTAEGLKPVAKAA